MPISKLGLFLKQLFSFLKGNEQGKRYRDRLIKKHGKGKALSILAHRMGRAVYFMLKNKKPFDQNTFLRL